MNCSQVRDAFLEHQTERLLGPGMRAHLSECEHCRALFEGGAELGRSLAAQASAPLAALDDLLGPFEDRIARETGLRAWLRSRPSRMRFQLVALVVLLVVLAGGALRIRLDFAAYPSGRLFLLAASYLGLVLFALQKELFSSARPRFFGERPWLSLSALGLPFLVAWVPATEASRHAGPEGALGCFGYGVLLTLPIALLLWALDRDDRPSLGTVCLSAVALGLSANLVLELHCENGNLVHLLLGHASIGVAWCAAWWTARSISPA